MLRSDTTKWRTSYLVTLALPSLQLFHIYRTQQRVNADKRTKSNEAILINHNFKLYYRYKYSSRNDSIYVPLLDSTDLNNATHRQWDPYYELP